MLLAENEITWRQRTRKSQLKQILYTYSCPSFLTYAKQLHFSMHAYLAALITCYTSIAAYSMHSHTYVRGRYAASHANESTQVTVQLTVNRKNTTVLETTTTVIATLTSKLF